MAICVFPPGEAWAGAVVASVAYGLSGPAFTVAALSLAVDLLGTGLFILAVRRQLEGRLTPTRSA